MRNLFVCLSLILSALAGAAPVGALPPPPSVPFAIVGADVVTMTEAGTLEDQTILVEDGVISRIGPRESVTILPGMQRLEAQGLWVSPGLVDMHVHIPNDPALAERALAVMLRYGVTTARSMAGHPSHLALREAVEAGEVAGPRLYLGAPAVNLATASGPEAAEALVRAAREQNFDLVKSHHITDLATWQRVQQIAAEVGLPVSGHVPNEIGLDRALEAGLQVEHLDGAMLWLLAADSPARAMEFGQLAPAPVVDALLQATDAEIAALARRVADSGVAQTPTLALFERLMDFETSIETLRSDPTMAYIPSATLDAWAQQRAGLTQLGLSPEQAAGFGDLRGRIAAAYQTAGVKLLAGSDTAQAFHVWGEGLLDELEALVAAGLEPREALATATVNPRAYFAAAPNGGSSLGWEASFGRIETGARADLLVLGADPTRDIAALRDLKVTIAGGRIYPVEGFDRAIRASIDAEAAAMAQDRHVVTILRHFETEQATDPALTAAGKANAQRLVEWLPDDSLAAIFVTDTRRSRASAAPLADTAGIEPHVYDPRDPDALAARVNNVDGDVVIFGHSNTVDGLIDRLGGEGPGELSHDAFGDVWQLRGGRGGTRHFRLDGPAPAALDACDTPGLPADALCGNLARPESASGERTIPVHFAVLPATGEASDDPLVVIPGGPGIGGVQSGGGIAQLFADFRNERDILLIDQRGTGRSNPLLCPSEGSLAEILSQAGGATPEDAEACRAELARHADLTAYSTRTAVRDTEAIRASLGYERLDQFGMSYGSRVALDYLRLYPDRVGETVIRAAAPSAMKLPLYSARDTQRSFDRLAATCAEQPACRDRFGDLRALLDRALGHVPAEIEIRDPASGEISTATIDRPAFASTMFFMLYIPQFYVQLPPLLEAAARGDFSPLFQAVAPAIMGTAGQVASGMRLSVICDEDIRQIDPGEIDRATAGTFMGRAAIDSDLNACTVWPAGTLEPGYLDPVESEKPVFIIAGEFDPIAGDIWSREIAQYLPNSVSVEVPGASHLPPLPGCTGRLMEEFLEGTPPDALDLSCISRSRTPELAR